MARYVTNENLRDQVRRMMDSGATQKIVADKMGISNGYLCDFLQGNRQAGPKILTALGYEIEPFYRLSHTKG
jgi:hypothetical protein